MIDNKVRYEIDGSGAFIGQTIGSVRALTDYTTTIELVSPLPRDTSVMVNFLVYDARNIDLPLFMIPIDKKGWQVSNNPLVADWNVWEVGIDQTALAAISKYRAGRIGVSFTFRERRPSKNALNYKGIFDEFNQLPLVGENDGDYYVCRGYNITVSGTLYTYNDNSVWQTDKWVRDRNMRITLTTTTIDLPVDPALLANVPDVPAQDIADLIAQWGGGFADMGSHINDADLHVSPIDRDFWDNMLPKDGSGTMEGNLNMDGNEITGADNIQFNRGTTVGGLGDNDFTINLKNGETFTFSENGLNMFLRKLTDVAKGVNSKDGANMENIADIKSDVDDLETEIGNIKNGTTIVKKAEQDASGNVITSTYETKIDATSKLLTKVDKTQKIIGIDLQDDILLTEFKTALGNATQSVAGLLSAEDKTHLDGLVALLENSDGNNVVDTIGEILEIFNNYPEGADLVTALNGKVDKVEGKGLSTNDFTDIDKNKVDLSYTHSEIVDGSNPHNTKFVNIADKPTTRDGYGITDVYTKPETYTQLEINNLLDNLSAVKGLKSTLLTPTELSNGDTISTNLLTNNGAFVVFTATNTSTGEIDSDTVPVSTIITGKKFVFFDNQEIVFIIGETNSTFETSEDITLKINLLYLDSENVKAVGVDFDGSLTNYLENQENVQSAINKLDEELKTTNDNSNNHITDTDNPHGVTATQVGLGNVDNTSDLDKPISTLTQNALNDKSNVGHKHTKSDITDFSHTHIKADITDFAHNHDDRYYTEEETNTLLNAKLNTSLKGAVNGLAELGSDGKVPSSQLPSYVDDVLEYTNLTTFPANGESGKIYVALDTNKTYRWSGSGYIEISASLAIGETSSTAGRGDWTKTAYDHTSLTNNPHSVTKAQVELSNVDNTSDLDKPISTAQQTALDNKVDKVSGKGLSTEDYTTDEKNKLAGLKVELTVETWNTATKTLALSDANKLILCASSGDQKVTIAPDSNVPFPIGTMITFSLIGTSKVTFVVVAGSGVILTSMDSLVELSTQYGMASLIKIATNMWQLVGALE